jgi:hypothetical protein
MPANNNFELRSEEIQEIIGHIPHWIIRRGITVVFSVFLIFIFCSYYVRFPDTFLVKAMINTKEQPSKIGWYRSEGLNYQTTVKDSQQVKAGDTLLVEENTPTHQFQYFTTPVSGRVFIVHGVEKNPRKSVMIIYPPISGYDVQLNIPMRGAGKAHQGQKVHIRLDNYPSEEFGFLEGKITTMIPVSIENYYRAEVHLTKGLITSNNVTLPVQHFLLGNAEIVLDEKNLFQRVFGINL